MVTDRRRELDRPSTRRIPAARHRLLTTGVRARLRVCEDGNQVDPNRQTTASD
jgi:hypothetical protein